MKMWRWVIRAMIAAVVLFMAVLAVPAIVGVRAYAVTSGSMEPAIHTGDMVYVRKKNFEEIKAGDILTFRINGGTMTVTHRVCEKSEKEQSFLTKGDANVQPDKKRIPYTDVCGTVFLRICGLGYAAVILGDFWGKLLAAVFLLWLFAMEAIVSDCRRIETGKELNRI